jgi:IclR family transcriptional regulator, blcABC operon repressor
MTSDTRDLAPAVTRAIQILDTLARASRPVRPSELAAALNLPKSSVHGVCSSLLTGGLIERTEGGEYVLGMRIVDLANARLAQNDLAQEFVRAWAAHPEFGQEAAVLSELDGSEVVYLACRNSVQPLGVTFRVGMRLPAAVTATGKALLSTLSDDVIDRLYARRDAIQPLTSRSVKSLSSLKAQLREIRRLGYSVDNGETREGMFSIGAPVLTRSGSQAVAGIALSFFRAELSERRERSAIAAVMDVAQFLSQKAASMDPA